MKSKLNLFLLFIFSQILACQNPVHEIYVSPNGNNEDLGLENSPLKTMESAIVRAKEIKDKNKDSPILIHVLSGTYRLQSPIRIGSGLSQLKIIGVGLDKVNFKGSQELHLSWKKYNDDILVSKIEDNIHFDQLFIDHKQQILARYPNYNENGGHWQGHAADAISPERVKTWKKPEGAIVHAMHSGEWGDFHYVITDVEENGEVILAGGHQNNRPSKLHDTYRMVENVFEELDSPGEWYFDKEEKLLYYWPVKGVDMENALVEGVYLKNLIEISGDENHPVQDITIQGIKFEHAQRTFMEKYEPLLRSDWTIYRGGAIFIERTENVSINNCEFDHLGGNVIFVSKYNRNINISANHIHDIGASAISFVGDPSAVRSPSFQYKEFIDLDKMDTLRGPLNNNYPGNSIVDNNLIYRTGRIEKQTAGVQISMSMGITVRHNSIYEVPRAGINIGDGTWGGHIIEYNDVFNTVLESSDHGAFNSWGRDRFWHPKRAVMDKITSQNPEMPEWDAIHTTIIRNNRFRCDHGWDIDLDDGSSNYQLYNNVCLKGGIKLREGFNRTVENNIMINNGFHPHAWFKNSGDIFRKNIVMTDYKDYKMLGWGKEVDYNLFVSEKALKKSQKNGTDTHSISGSPGFVNPKAADYRLVEDSPASELGFMNFPMDNFGVEEPKLKAIAKSPEIPVIWSDFNSKTGKSAQYKLLGANLKNIETLEERSASGLKKTAGVYIISIEKESVLGKSKLKVGDVIIGGEGEEINTIADLMNVFGGHNWKGKLNLIIVRNQEEKSIIILTK